MEGALAQYKMPSVSNVYSGTMLESVLNQRQDSNTDDYQYQGMAGGHNSRGKMQQMGSFSDNV